MATTRLPVAYALREHVMSGGLLSYGADLAANYRHAATFVDKILKGAKPADLPVEQATKFDPVINLRTAKALGIAIPQTVLLRADEVIQQPRATSSSKRSVKRQFAYVHRPFDARRLSRGGGVSRLGAVAVVRPSVSRTMSSPSSDIKPQPMT